MKVGTLAVLLAVIGSGTLQAQFTESQILEKGGIKSMGAGSANGARSGETEFFPESPASPADIEVPFLSLNYGDIAGFNNFLNLSYSHPTLRGVLSGNIRYFNANGQNAGLNNAININANFSKAFTEKLFVGFGFRFITADYFGESGAGIGLNLGVIYHVYEYTGNRKNKFLENIKIGLSALNLGYPVLYNDEVIALPFTLKTGPSFVFNFSTNVQNISSLDLDIKKFKDADLCFGTETVFFKKYILRLGYGIDSDYQDFSFGIGYRFNIKNINAELDYSFVSAKNDKILHYLGMEMRFGKPDEEPPQTGLGFNLENVSPNYDGKADYLVIKPEISDNKILKYWDLKILNAKGETVKSYQSPDLDTLKGKITFGKIFTRLFEKEKEAPVPDEIIWDGIDMNGKDVPDGLYRAVLTARDEKENVSPAVEKSFIVDKTPPEIKVTADYRIFSPNGDGNKDTIKFLLDIRSEKEDVWTARINNAKGETVKEYSWKGTDKKEIEWDGKDQQGNPVPDGNYDLVIDGSDSAQNAVKSGMSGLTLTTARQSLAVTAALDEFSPNKDGILDKTRFDLYLSDPKGLERWKFSILNVSGEMVRSFQGETRVPESLEWDGTDNNGKTVPDGTYLYKIEAWYDSGNHPESFLKKIRTDITPPEVVLTIAPDLFSPDGDGNDDRASFRLNVKDSSQISSWSLVIFENSEKTVFKKFEQTGAPAGEITWNGLGDTGKLVQSKNKYPVQFQIEDKVGNKTLITGKEVAVSTVPPDVDFDFEPQLFSPDDDGESDLLTIKIYSYNNKKIKNWKFSIYPVRGGKRESLFIHYSGTNLPNKPVIWDGRNRKGELVESAMDYSLELVAEDILGNVKTVTKTLNVDILVIKTPYGLKIKISNIEFEYNKADLIGNAFRILDNVNKKLNKYPTYKVILEGHTDSIGGEEYNLKLSEKRAESVYRYLTDNGFDPARLTQRGLGLTRPVAPNTNPDGSDNPEGRAKNRRVEFLLVKPGAKVTPE